MVTLCFTNQKGGTGKTTMACLFAYYLVSKKAKVLFIDLDSQGNASKTLSNHTLKNISSSDLFHASVSSGQFINSENILNLVSGGDGLIEVDRGSNDLLIQFVNNWDEIKKAGYDYCVIDTAPSLSLKMTSALFVSDYVLSPIELEEYSFDGLVKMFNTIQNIKVHNEKLEFIGMLPNRVKGNSPRQKKTYEQLKETYPNYVLPFAVPDRQCIPEALGQKMPVWDLKKPSARSTGKLLKEIFQAIEQRIKTN